MNIAIHKKPKLTVVKGGRQSGKSTYVLSNLGQANVVIAPHVAMSRLLLNRYMNRSWKHSLGHVSGHIISDEIAVTRNPELASYFTIFSSAQVAYHALEMLLTNSWGLPVPTVFIDEVNMINIDRLARIIQYCQQAGLPVVATFTPTVVTPRNAYTTGWLNLGQWYDDIEYIELPAHTDWHVDFSKRLEPEQYATEILGEYVLADDPTPQHQLPNGEFA